MSLLFVTLSSTCFRICLLPNFPLPFAVAQITVALLHTVPFFVAVFTRPIFRCPFFWLPFFRCCFFRCLNYCYQIYNFFRTVGEFIYFPIFRCPIFPLPFLPFPFSVAFLPLLFLLFTVTSTYIVLRCCLMISGRN